MNETKQLLYYNQRMLSLTERQMLELWKSRIPIAPTLSDCTLERYDGVEVDTFLIQRIREWYAEMLATGVPQFLPHADVVDKLGVTVSDDKVVEVILPESVVRPVEIKMQSWRAPLTTFLEPDDYPALLQAYDHTRSRRRRPVAVQYSDRLLLYSAGSTDDVLERAVCVIRPPEGTYMFDEALLALMPREL